MNKNSIKKFAIWARNKLIADIQYRAGLMGITAEEIKSALPQSTKETEFYDIGTTEPYAITGEAIKQRRSLVSVINQKADETNYKTAYKYIIEGVAYTWFNRLIAVRFMEINDYLPSHIRVLSSDSGKMEPDIVTNPFDAELPFSDEEKQEIIRLKNDNNLDEAFRLLFIKQCNALNEYLPALFEKTADYTELLLNISAIDKEGVVYHLVNDISEDDFNIEKGGQVEIIGWLYQYYNTEPKNEAFAKSGKITKEEIPAVTQLFTPDWIVRYMVENSLGRLWVEGHANDLLKSKWKYYLEEAEQEPEVQAKLQEIHKEYAKLNPEDIHFIDPCMGSGHILVYAFDVLMQIYEAAGYSQRDAAKSILENNLYGLDIDDRAYQMAYFAVMMKARQYNRRILSADTVCHVYSIQDSNSINRNQLKYFGSGLNEVEKNDALNQIEGLLDTFKDAKEYGSILNVENYNWDLLRRFVSDSDIEGQMTLDAVGLPQAQERMKLLIDIGETMARKYESVVTNPPYLSGGAMPNKLSCFCKKNYEDSKVDLYSCMMKKSFSLLNEYGFHAMITMEGWMFAPTQEKFREFILNEKSIVCLLHMPYLGRGRTSLGINFGTDMAIVRNTSCYLYKGTYQRISYYEIDDEGVPFSFPVRNVFCNNIQQIKFDTIPGKTISYWVSEKAIDSFKNLALGSISRVKTGLQTGNNAQFLRLWFEVKFNDIEFDANSNNSFIKKWYPHTKGGDYRKWYGNYQYIIDWQNDGERIKNESGAVIRGEQYYFGKGITWSHTTSGGFSGRLLPKGFIINVESPSVFEEDKLEYYMGVLNSKYCELVFDMLNSSMHYLVGNVAKVPIKDSNREYYIKELVDENISEEKIDWDSFETSWDFKKHPLI